MERGIGMNHDVNEMNIYNSIKKCGRVESECCNNKPTAVEYITTDRFVSRVESLVIVRSTQAPTS